MLDPELKEQLEGYLKLVSRPIEITADLDDSEASQEMRGLLQDLSHLSTQIHVSERVGESGRKPSFSLNTPGQDIGLGPT